MLTVAASTGRVTFGQLHRRSGWQSILTDRNWRVPGKGIFRRIAHLQSSALEVTPGRVGKHCKAHSSGTGGFGTDRYHARRLSMYGTVRCGLSPQINTAGLSHWRSVQPHRYISPLQGVTESLRWAAGMA
jgi:hypothetical protein